MNGRAKKFEKELDHALKQDWGRAMVGKRLGLEIVSHPELTEKALVAFCMPSYKNAHPWALTALHQMLAHSRQFCDVKHAPVMGSSVVHWARNQLLAGLLKQNVPFTHALFVDDDIVVEEDTLVKLLRHEKDIVAAVCTTRCDPPRRNARALDEDTHAFVQIVDMPPGALMEVGAMGTGVMLISRKCLDRVGEYWINCEREEKFYGASKEYLDRARAERKNWYEQTKDAFWFQFLEHPHGRGEFGEDVSFCWKAKQCGFSVFADTALKPQHVGDYGYTVDDADAHRHNLIAQLKADGKSFISMERLRQVTE